MAANTIRLLIAGSQAGSLIGMSGENIEKLRNSSGATVMILAPNQLPLCASAYESDRVVQVCLLTDKYKGKYYRSSFADSNHCRWYMFPKF